MLKLIKFLNSDASDFSSFANSQFKQNVDLLMQYGLYMIAKGQVTFAVDRLLFRNNGPEK